MNRATHTESRATIVGRPCAGDAIGVALRDAYSRERSVPDDLMILIARINGGVPNRT